MSLLPHCRRSLLIGVALSGLLHGAEPILRQTFDKGAEGWVSMGKTGRVEASGGQLNFLYTAADNAPGAAVLPLQGVATGEMRAIQFELKTDVPCAVGVILSEKKPGGGNYTAMLWSNGPQWQRAALVPEDFHEGEGPNEPVDSDGKLDFDQVEGVGLLDVSQIFAKLSGTDSPIFAQEHRGEHSLSIRKFEILRDGVASTSGWFGLADAKIINSANAASIAYSQNAEQAVAFLHAVPAGDYRGSTHLAFDISSSRPAQFVFSLQQGRHHGPEAARYNVDFFVPSGADVQHREIALSAFALDENGPASKSGKLDLSDLRTLSLLDISREEASNVLTLKNVRFVTH